MNGWVGIGLVMAGVVVGAIGVVVAVAVWLIKGRWYW
jgi:hypothetical protein